MKRRTLLKVLLAVPVLSLLPRFLLRAAAVAGRKQNRIRPSDPAWPNAASWKKLNDEVGGNLIEVPPLFGTGANAASDVRNPFYIGDQPAGTQVSGYLDAWTPASSVYAIKARTAADVVAAVNFARDHRLRLVVKGAGHSYQGTSNAPDSLLVWTHDMNQVTLLDRFVPRG